MRRSLLRCGILPAAAALAVLTGCTSDEPDITGSEETTAAETTSGSGTETETETETEAAATTEFCAAASNIESRITQAIAGSDPANVPQAVSAVAEEIRAIEAPDELEDDWTALADGVEQFAASLQDIDFSDPNALANLQQELAPLQQQLDEALGNVQTYLAEECEIAVTEESAPTS